MNLSEVLSKLKAHGISVFVDDTNAEGYRCIQVGCTLPGVDYGGRMRYATLILSPGQDDVCLEERESLKRRLCHLTTNIFGDDPDGDSFLGDDPEDDPGSHFQQIVPQV